MRRGSPGTPLHTAPALAQRGAMQVGRRVLPRRDLGASRKGVGQELAESTCMVTLRLPTPRTCPSGVSAPSAIALCRSGSAGSWETKGHDASYFFTAAADSRTRGAASLPGSAALRMWVPSGLVALYEAASPSASSSTRQVRANTPAAPVGRVSDTSASSAAPAGVHCRCTAALPCASHGSDDTNRTCSHPTGVAVHCPTARCSTA